VIDMVSAWAAKGAAAMARSEAKTMALLRTIMAISPGVSVVAGRCVRTFIFVAGQPRLRTSEIFLTRGGAGKGRAATRSRSVDEIRRQAQLVIRHLAVAHSHVFDGVRLAVM